MWAGLFPYTFAKRAEARKHLKTRNLNKCLLWKVSAELKDKNEIGGKHKNLMRCWGPFFMWILSRNLFNRFSSLRYPLFAFVLFSVRSVVKGAFTSFSSRQSHANSGIFFASIRQFNIKAIIERKKFPTHKKSKPDTVHYTTCNDMYRIRCVLAHLRQIEKLQARTST